MKTILSVALFCTLALLLCLPKPIFLTSENLENPKKKFLMDFLDKTEQDFMITLDTMHIDVTNFKPDAGSWSAKEVLNHVVVAEKLVFAQISEALDSPSETQVDLSANDAWLIGKVNDRGIKVKSPLPEPSNNKTINELKSEFKSNRNIIDNFIETHYNRLRSHYGQSPYGKADCYQLFLVLAAHSMRHQHQLLDNIKMYYEENKG